jgi:hypothetical protein
MSVPRAPRKSTGGVDVQLEEFEAELRGMLEFQLVLRTDNQFWDETGALSIEDNRSTEWIIDDALTDLMHRYKSAQDVINILEHCRILIQNVVWAAMNVPRPAAAVFHIEAVINNTMEVYNRVIYAPLRTEMIMANHNVEVLQRTWRRCITDPTHPACRRRLQFEFSEATEALKNVL